MSLGYLLLYQLFGPKPLVFHAANLLVHVGVVLLVYKVTERIFPKLGLVAAIIFALHPVHSESVDWVGAITDLELSLFYLAAFYFYLRIPRLAEHRLDWRRLRMQAAAVVALALAMLSKEQALTLPVLATLYEHFYREDRGETGTRRKNRALRTAVAASSRLPDRAAEFFLEDSRQSSAVRSPCA